MDPDLTSVSAQLGRFTELVYGSDLERDWRGQLARGMLRAVSLVATLAIMYFCYNAYVEGSYWVIPVYVAAYVLLIGISFLRRVPAKVQSAVLVVLVYGLALTDLVDSGRVGDGRVFLMAAPAVVTLLYGRRLGVIALGANVGIMVAFGWAFSNGVLDLPLDRQSNYANAAAWASNALVLLVLGVLVVFAQGYVSSWFGALVGQGNSLADEAAASREVLEKQEAELASAKSLVAEMADSMRVIAQIAREAGSGLQLDEFLERTVSLIGQQFGFYHIGIFIIDLGGVWAELRAASSAGGRRMLARRHRLRVGQEGIIGYVTRQGVPRIAQNVGQDSVFYDNPDLPDTRSEMAVPLLYQGHVIGALDVQSREPDAFGDVETSIMQALADLVVVASQSAESARRVQAGADMDSRSVDDISSEAWLERVRRGRTVGYRYESSGVTRAIERTSSAGEIGEEESGLPRVSIPLTARGRVIGHILAHKEQVEADWTTEEVDLMETLATQLDTALESARLYEDTQDRATRDRLISEVAGRIRETLDVNTVLRTAADEMYNTLGLSEVVIRLIDVESDELSKVED